MVRKPVTATVDDRTTLPCRTNLSTPVDWYYKRSQNERGDVICVAGIFVNGYDGRFALDRSIQGDFNLIIQNVNREDEGEYICVEDAGFGTRHRMTLRVENSKHHYVCSCLNITEQLDTFKLMLKFILY